MKHLFPLHWINSIYTIPEKVQGNYNMYLKSSFKKIPIMFLLFNLFSKILGVDGKNKWKVVPLVLVKFYSCNYLECIIHKM